MVQIETERLLLRPHREDDLMALHETIYSDADVTRYLPGGKPRPLERTTATLEQFIKHQAQHGFSLWAVIEKETGAFVGQAGVFYPPARGGVEVAYAFGKNYWGKGYATEVVRAAIRYAFEVAQLPMLHAVAEVDNVPSQKVMQKVGMVYQGEITFEVDPVPLVHYAITPDTFDPGDAFYKVHSI